LRACLSSIKESSSLYSSLGFTARKVQKENYLQEGQLPVVIMIAVMAAHEQSVSISFYQRCSYLQQPIQVDFVTEQSAEKDMLQVKQHGSCAAHSVPSTS